MLELDELLVLGDELEAILESVLDDEEPTQVRVAPPLFEPEPLVLLCPRCGRQHLDEGPWAVRPHRTHLCLNSKCGHLWTPRSYSTVGIPVVSTGQLQGLQPHGMALHFARIESAVGAKEAKEAREAWVLREARRNLLASV